MANVYCKRKIQKDNFYQTDTVTKVADKKFTIKSSEDYKDSKLVVDTDKMIGYFCFTDASQTIADHVEQSPIYTVITKEEFETLWNL